MFENARRLLDRNDTDAEQLSDFVERADLSARLPRQNHITQFRGGRLHELASWDFCHAFGSHRYTRVSVTNTTVLVEGRC